MCFLFLILIKYSVSIFIYKCAHIILLLTRSEEVEAKLENEVGQIYSPVRDHPFFQLQQRQLQKQKEEQQQQQQKEQQQREQQHREQRESKPKYQQQQEQLKQQQQQSPGISLLGPFDLFTSVPENIHYYILIDWNVVLPTNGC